jgi:HSP20 family protein
VAVQKWRPFGMLTSLQKDINRLFEDFWPMRREDIEEGMIAPALDVSEDKENVYVAADLPGVEEKDIKLNLQNGILTLSGEKREEKETKEKNFHRIERSYGSFSRSLALPCQVAAEKAIAKFKNGVLNVTLPKKEEAKPKEINIKVE